MTEAEADAALTAIEIMFPVGNAFFVFQDVADAKNAIATQDMPNTEFARTNKKFNNKRIYLFKRAGTKVHHGQKNKMRMNTGKTQGFDDPGDV